MREIHILLVEDNEGDIVLTKEALADARVRNIITVKRDGEEAINYLNATLTDPDELVPDLVLLDINLPRIDGKEVLDYIKSHNVLNKIPVVILTTSSSPLDVTESYNKHANCFITKPVDVEKFFDVVNKIEEFWISIVKLPSKK